MKRFLQLFSLLIFLSYQGVWAQQTYEITSTSDSGAGSLREYIENGVIANGDILTIDGSIQLFSSITISNSITIQGKTADAKITAATGYRVFNVEANQTVTFENLKLEGNSAASEAAEPGSGGILLVQEATAIIKNVHFTNSETVGQNGGAIYSSKSQLNLENNTFTGSSATKYGGAIFTDGEGTKVSSAGDQFISNTVSTALGQGSAIYFEECLTLEASLFDGCLFKDNSGRMAGAIISGISLDIKNCRFEGNEATGSTGGALYLWKDSYENKSTVESTTFTGNSAYTGGGAITVGYGATLDISTTVFTKNRVAGYVYSSGGALYVEGGSIVNLKDVIFGKENEGNTADYTGGAIRSNAGTVIMTGGSIEANEAPVGSAISSGGASALKLINVSVVNNTSTGAGGTVFTNEITSSELTNVLLAGNRCEVGTGGGLRSVKTPTVLTNVTIVDNYAKNGGGGIYNNNSPLIKVRNSVIWGNTKDGDAISNTGINSTGGTFEYSYSLIGGASPAGEGNIPSTDPMFNTTNSTAPYSLLPTSPLLNAGNNAYFSNPNPDLSAVTTDLAGNARIYDKANFGKVDVGAYELMYSSLVYHSNFDADQTESIDYILESSATISTYEATGLPVRTGYTFAYWASEASGSGTIYTPGALLDMLDIEHNLYAQWNAIPVPPIPTEPVEPGKPDPDPDPSGNAEVEDGIRIYSNAGAVYVQTEKTGLRVQIAGYNGKVYTQQQLPVGETIVPLPTGYYIVTLSDGTTRKVRVAK